MSKHFLFARDFREPRGGDAPQADTLKAAEERAYADGFRAGQARARAEADAGLASAVARLADLAARLLEAEDARAGRLETEAAAFATGLGRKLAGAAIEAMPLAAIEDTARAAFQHLRGVPHLVVRVNETLVEGVDELVRTIARERGYEGRLVVLGEPDIPAGDVRLEWADGGVVRDGAAIDAAVAQALAAAFPDQP